MIAGWFDPDAPHPLPRVNVAIQLPRVAPEWAVIPFVVDTGAGVTCLHLDDAMRVARINPVLLGDPMRWPGVATYQGVGGTVQYFQSPAQYRLEHADGRSQLLEDKIHVAPWKYEALPLPSVLGWDVLRHFRVMLDWSLGLVELHSLPPTPSDAGTATPS